MGTTTRNRRNIAFRLIQLGLSFLPLAAAAAFGRLLGRLFYLMDTRHRRIALSNLKTAFGSELTARERKKIARRSFMHFGRLLVDILKFSRKKPEWIASHITISGEEHLRRAVMEGRGALLFSAHFGNWEIAPLLISRFGRVNVIARALDITYFEEELRDIREKFKARVIYKDQAVKNVLRALQNREMVAILIDQNVLRSQGVFVDFFSKKASTTPALATFHLRSQAPIVGVFCRPVSPTRYHIEITPPLSISYTGDVDRDVLEITSRCTKIIEERIRRSPEYWLWFHDRWKSRPAEQE